MVVYMAELDSKLLDFQSLNNQINNQINIPLNDLLNRKNSNEDFDMLQLYFGEPYTISCGDTADITIKQPSIGDILKHGERKFYSTLYIFILNPTSYRLQLWDMGIDWNKISDYELFCMFIREIDNETASLLFKEEIDFQSFELFVKKTNDGEVMSLCNEKQNIEITESTYNCISTYLRTMFNIFPKVEKAKGKATKEAIIEEERINQVNSLKNSSGNTSTLLPLISACVNHPGFKYKLSELREIGIVQFMDSVQRLQIYESTTALMKGIYSGMVDSKNLDKEALNFMREIKNK